MYVRWQTDVSRIRAFVWPSETEPTIAPRCKTTTPTSVAKSSDIPQAIIIAKHLLFALIKVINVIHTALIPRLII
jgi:hypothetical protein